MQCSKICIKTGRWKPYHWQCKEKSQTTSHRILKQRMKQQCRHIHCVRGKSEPDARRPPRSLIESRHVGPLQTRVYRQRVTRVEVASSQKQTAGRETLRWKRAKYVPQSFGFPASSPQWPVRIELPKREASPGKKSQLSWCYAGNSVAPPPPSF